MGEPAWSNVHALPPEYIGRVETTGGTETSKYLEEKKSTEIALVAASERADSLNPCMCKCEDVAACGVVGPNFERASPLLASYKMSL